MSKLHAVLVAINDYPGKIASLSGCINDMENVKNYLKNRIDTVNGAYTLQLPETAILRNEQATREGIIRAFDHFKAADSGDICLFYYSGHGSRVPAPKEFHHLESNHKLQSIVCCGDRSGENRDLLDKELRWLIFNATRGKTDIHFVTIMDCCFAGNNFKGDHFRARMTPTSEETPALEDFLGIEDYIRKTRQDGKEELDPPSLDHIYHIALSAAYPHETSKEILDFPSYGIFTQSLLSTLSHLSRPVSYRELLHRTLLKVEGTVKDQTPLLETDEANKDLPFLLGEALSYKNDRFVSWKIIDDKSFWALDAGMFDGVKIGNTYQVDYQENPVEVGVEEVFQGFARVTGMPEDANPNEVYAASISRIAPEGLTQVGFSEDSSAEIISLFEEIFQGQLSELFVLTREASETQYLIHADESLGAFWFSRLDDDSPLFARINNLGKPGIIECINRIDKVLKWEQVKKLENRYSTLQPHEIEIALTRVTSNEEGHSTEEVFYGESHVDLTVREERGKPVYPRMRIKVRNTGGRKLYVGGILLTPDYAITDQFLSASEPIGPGQEVKFLIQGIHEEFPMGIEEKFRQLGFSSIRDYVKIIVSTEKFRSDFANQPGLELEPKDTFLGGKFIISNAMLDQNAWQAYTLSLDIHQPLDFQSLAEDSPTTISGISVQAPAGFAGEVSFEGDEMGSRSIGEKRPPNTLLPAPLGDIAGYGQGLSVMKIRPSAGIISPEQPLAVKLPANPLADDVILPIGYDGETGLFLPVGYPEDESTIRIENLPDPEPAGERDLGSSLKIYFRKLLRPKVYEYPVLTLREIDAQEEIAQEFRDYVPEELEKIKAAVADASNILVLVHGLIGDTEDKSKIMRRAHSGNGESARDLTSVYQICLAFDYENLNTPIEETAKLFKEKLEKVGLGPNHGKTLHLVAHSMGGLVCRWFLEREEGDAYVSHFVQVASPNLGSPWANTYDWVLIMLGKGINELISFPNPIVKGLYWLFKRGVKRAVSSVHVTTRELKKGSQFIETLNMTGTRSQTPYTLIAGNRKMIPETEAAAVRKMLKRIGGKSRAAIDKFLFKEENDEIVGLSSMKGIPEHKASVEAVHVVGCNHFAYFYETPGVEKLAEVLFGLFEETHST